MVPAGAPLPNLAGRKILVVEDDYFIAQDTCNMLNNLGAHVIGPVANVDSALSLAKSQPDLGAAVLDVNLRDVSIFPVADILKAAGVPFVFVTGYDKNMIPERFHDVQHIEKPIDPNTLMRILEE